MDTAGSRYDLRGTDPTRADRHGVHSGDGRLGTRRGGATNAAVRNDVESAGTAATRGPVSRGSNAATNGARRSGDGNSDTTPNGARRTGDGRSDADATGARRAGEGTIDADANGVRRTDDGNDTDSAQARVRPNATKMHDAVQRARVDSSAAQRADARSAQDASTAVATPSEAASAASEGDGDADADANAVAVNTLDVPTEASPALPATLFGTTLSATGTDIHPGAGGLDGGSEGSGLSEESSPTEDGSTTARSAEDATAADPNRGAVPHGAGSLAGFTASPVGNSTVAGTSTATHAITRPINSDAGSTGRDAGPESADRPADGLAATRQAQTTGSAAAVQVSGAASDPAVQIPPGQAPAQGSHRGEVTAAQHRSVFEASLSAGVLAAADAAGTALAGAIAFDDPASAGAELGMNVWADRLRGATARATQVAELASETLSEAPQVTQAFSSEGLDLANGGADDASTPAPTLSKPEKHVPGFQIPAPTVDTVSSPAGPPVGTSRPAAHVATTVDEILRGHASLGETSSARVEVEVDGQRISVRVHVRNGRVDVEVGGLDPAELARLHDDLGEQLRGHDLTLGDLTQDTGNERRGDREAREADGEAPAAADATSVAEARVDEARRRHDGTVYVTA